MESKNNELICFKRQWITKAFVKDLERAEGDCEAIRQAVLTLGKRLEEYKAEKGKSD